MKRFAIISLFFLVISLPVLSEYSPLKSLGRSSQPLLVSQEKKRADKIVLSLQIPEPKFVTSPNQRIDGETTCLGVISNLPFTGTPGEPQLPRIPMRVILPYGKGIESIEVITSDERAFALTAPLAFAEMQVPISAKGRVTASAKREIYSSSEQYPLEVVQELDIQKAFGVSIATFNLLPMVYTPEAQKAIAANTLTVIIHLDDITPSNDIRIDIERFKERGALTEENAEALETYPNQRVRAETYDYILITSEEIANNTSVTPNVSDLIALRESQGFSCKVVTTEEIQSEYSGATIAAKVRNFIKFAYNTWGAKFVTLGGDTNILGNLTVKIWYGWDRFLPSDMPYQGLDGDSWSGDYEAEVYVGRMAAENAQEFSNQLHKIITYETADHGAEWLRTSLGAGSNLDTQNWGMDAIVHLYNTIFPEGWVHDSLYEKMGDWSQSDMIAKLGTNRYGSVNHDGHATENGTMSFGKDDTGNMTNTTYPFVYTLSCLAGKFTVDCIAERLISEHSVGGFFGGILNSDVGLYSSNNSLNGGSPALQRSFWRGFWDADLKYFSQMNAYSHQMTHGEMSERFSCATTNYFGDAATRFRGKDHIGESVVENDYATMTSINDTFSSLHATMEKVSFTVDRASLAGINMYALNGKQVYVIPQQLFQKGNHSIALETKGLAKGVYIVEVASGLKSKSFKVQI